MSTPADLVLLSDRVLWMTPGEPVGAGFVAVSGGVIVGTGPRERAGEHVGADTEVVDVGSRPLMPGFVDVHAHVEVAARTALGRSTGLIEREEPAHAGIIAENGRRVDVAAGNLWMPGQDRAGLLQRPRAVPGVQGYTRRVDESRQRVF